MVYVGRRVSRCTRQVMLYAAQLEAEVRSGEIEATRAATRRLEANFAAELTAAETHWQAAVDQLHVIPSIPSFPTPLASLSRYRLQTAFASSPLARSQPPGRHLPCSSVHSVVACCSERRRPASPSCTQSLPGKAKPNPPSSRACARDIVSAYVLPATCASSPTRARTLCASASASEPANQTPIFTGQRCARSVGRRARAGACPPWRSALPSGRALRVCDCRREAERARTDERTALLLGAAAEREGQLAAELRARTQAAAALEAELARQPHRPALDDLQVRISPSKHTAARARAHSRARTHTRAHTW